MLAYQLTVNFNDILAECQEILHLPKVGRYEASRPLKDEIVPGMAINAFHINSKGSVAWSLPWGQRGRQRHYLSRTSLSQYEFANPQWADALSSRRCLIPMNGFYTWPYGMNQRVLFAIVRTRNEPKSVKEVRARWLTKRRYEMIAGVWGKSWYYQKLKGQKGEWLQMNCVLPLVSDEGFPLIVPKNLWWEWMSKPALSNESTQLSFDPGLFTRYEFCPV